MNTSIHNKNFVLDINILTVFVKNVNLNLTVYQIKIDIYDIVDKILACLLLHACFCALADENQVDW